MSVYFMTCREATAVKIGSSLDPHARLPEIQYACPLLLKVEAILPGGRDEEFAFHRRFVDDRIRGEWFTITTMIEEIIAANPAPPPPIREERKAAVRTEATTKRRTFMTAKQLEQAKHDAEIEKWREGQRRIMQRQLAKREAAGDIIFPWRGESAA